VQEIVDVDDLLDGVRLARLLAVSEGGVGDPDFGRRLHWHADMIEKGTRYFGVGEHFADQIGAVDLLESETVRVRQRVEWAHADTSSAWYRIYVDLG